MQRASTRTIRGSEKAGRTALRNDAIMYMSILSARDLKVTQLIGVQDPYVDVTIMSGGSREAVGGPAFKTSTHENGGEFPQWNEKTNFVVSDVASDVLRIRVMNENWVGSNVIGETVVAVKDLSRGRSMERELALTPKGFLKVRMYLSMGHENPNSQARAPGQYPRYFIANKTKLYLGIASAEKLRDIQTFGTQDPYCDVYLSKTATPSASDHIYRTQTHDNGGKHPKWLEAITISTRCIEHDYLTIRIMNDNHVKDAMIGELVMKVETLLGQEFVDKPYPVEADGTIVGHIKLQMALFNDEVLTNLDNATDGDLDGCTCNLKRITRPTKVGSVLINGIAPTGVQYLEAGSVVMTGCDIAGDYVLDKDFYDGEQWDQHEYEEDFREANYVKQESRREDMRQNTLRQSTTNKQPVYEEYDFDDDDSGDEL